MSFVKAASLPDSYTKAYYSLVTVANIRETDSVLIQNVDIIAGQAAVHVATKIGCQIIATVSSEKQRESLLSAGAFALADYNIFISGVDDLPQAVQLATGGRGVSVLLLNGRETDPYALKPLLQSVAPFGRVVQLDSQSSYQPALTTLRNVAWTTVDTINILRHSRDLASSILSETMALALNDEIRTRSPRVEPLSKMAESMQKLRSSDMEVKTVFEPQAGDLIHVVPQRLESLLLQQDGSYLLIGGFGGIGRSLALWMVERGAKHLIFVSRRSTLSTKASELVNLLEAQNVSVRVLTCDVSDEEKFTQGLRELLSHMPPLRGVINSAMDLQDSIFVNMSHDMFLNGLKPKVQGSWTLHKATLDQPLDFFIMLSSAAAFFGSIAQANYVAACTYQVALAAHRRTLGLPAVSVDVSKIIEVGYVAEDETGASNRNLTQLGMVEVRPEELLCLLEMAMQPTSADTNNDMPNGHLLTGVHSTNDATKGEDLPFWSRDPIFSHMDFVRPHILKSKKGEKDESTLKRPLEESLKMATSPEEAESHLSEGLLQKLARALMMKVEDLDPKKAMSAYGVDSLVAVDLRNWLARSAGVDMPVFEILRPVSLATLVQQAVMKSSFVNMRNSKDDGSK
jgi:NADPH:quinone reductase-like Zn-dependent oxidoreductase